jgi:hypothetical protein
VRSKGNVALILTVSEIGGRLLLIGGGEGGYLVVGVADGGDGEGDGEGIVTSKVKL